MPDATFSKILQLVRLVETGLKRIDARHGLSGSQLLAMWHISANPEIRVTDLAEAMHSHHSTASNLLDRLEIKGLISRIRQTNDTRVVRINLTAAGIELVKGIPGPLQGHLRSTLQLLPDPVLEGLHDGLTRLLQDMREKTSY